jgi:hypothetical protein
VDHSLRRPAASSCMATVAAFVDTAVAVTLRPAGGSIDFALCLAKTPHSLRLLRVPSVAETDCDSQHRRQIPYCSSQKNEGPVPNCFTLNGETSKSWRARPPGSPSSRQQRLRLDTQRKINFQCHESNGPVRCYNSKEPSQFTLLTYGARGPSTFPTNVRGCLATLRRELLSVIVRSRML